MLFSHARLVSLFVLVLFGAGCTAPPPATPTPLNAKVLPLTRVPAANPCVGVVPPDDKWLPLPDVRDGEIEEADTETTDLEEADVEVSDLGPLDASDALALDLPQPLPPIPPPPRPLDVDAASSDADVGPSAPDGSGPDADEASDADGLDDTAPACRAAPATCVGANAPTWEAFDFQPASCGYQATYGLTQFRGRVTVVALLAGW